MHSKRFLDILYKQARETETVLVTRGFWCVAEQQPTQKAREAQLILLEMGLLW